MVSKKTKDAMVDITLVEVTKSNNKERKRVIDGMQGTDLGIEFIGGIWKEKSVKFPCPQCHKHHTTIELSIHDIGWDGVGPLTKSGGSIESLLGNFTIYCNDCKKLFTYSPSGDISLDYVEEMPYEEHYEE